jgi:hypothetical protein
MSLVGMGYVLLMFLVLVLYCAALLYVEERESAIHYRKWRLRDKLFFAMGQSRG